MVSLQDRAESMGMISDYRKFQADRDLGEISVESSQNLRDLIQISSKYLSVC